MLPLLGSSCRRYMLFSWPLFGALTTPIVQWLGRQSFLDDLASLDPELYNGLIFLKHYDGNPEDLALNFTVATDGMAYFPSLPSG